jgi:4-amino-4-deoxy-L-arabinose transferase-like glycosyltransferase
LFIIALGIFLRVYNINNTPPGVYPDEAVNGLDALTANNTGQYQWFYPANNGREGLFMNLIAFCFRLFGVSVLTLKLPAIIFGILTIWGIYLLTKEFFRSERLGLISSFLVATSFWAINFSRISFRAGMLPSVLVFSFYFLLKGLRDKKWLNFAVGGFIFGVGFHTYIAFRIAPVILVLMLFVLIYNRRHFLKEYWKLILIFVVFAAIAAAPMLYTLYVSHPEYLESRSASISILSPEVNQGHLFKTFFKSFSLSLLKYNFWGDQNWRHNFPPYPLLDPISGMAFMFGLIYAVIKFFHLAALRIFKKVRDEKTEVFFLLLASFFIMLVPEFMTAEGNPHALRAIGTLPFVFIFSALTLNYFFEYAENHNRIFKKTIAVIFIFMIISIGFFNSIKYHAVWAKKKETAKAFEKNNMNIVKYVQTLPDNKEVFVVLDNMQRVPLRLFNRRNQNFHDLHPEEISSIRPKNANNLVVIFTDYEKDFILKKIKLKFPDLKLEEKTDNFGLTFYVLK